MGESKRIQKRGERLWRGYCHGQGFVHILFWVFLCFCVFCSIPPPPYVLILVYVGQEAWLACVSPSPYVTEGHLVLTDRSNHSIKTWSFFTTLPNNSVLFSSAYWWILVFSSVLQCDFLTLVFWPHWQTLFLFLSFFSVCLAVFLQAASRSVFSVFTSILWGDTCSLPASSWSAHLLPPPPPRVLYFLDV